MIPKYKRKSSPRLKDYDYSQPGAYFVTTCTHQKVCLFGEVVDGEIILNDAGKIVRECWLDLPNHYSNVQLDEFIVMPNHVHGIVFIRDDQQSNCRDRFSNLSLRKQHGLSEIVRGFKTWSSRRVNKYQNTPGVPLWQRSFYDHIIRDEDDLDRARKYILNNTQKWEFDREIL